MTAARDPWRGLVRFTPARIGLGRTGISLPTARALEFQAAHAAARTAVHAAFDAEAMAAQLANRFPGSLVVESRAETRAVYLQRPDLGRRLSDASAERLAAAASTQAPDVAIIICDGLSALAVERNATRFLSAFTPRAQRQGWTLAPLVLATQARVALGDEVGELLRARLALLLIGERPGLSAADSLGLYITHGPRLGLTDADRNCVSNVRDGGLAHPDAAYRAEYLIAEALKRGLSGVALKDDTVTPAEAVEGGAVPRLPVL